MLICQPFDSFHIAARLEDCAKIERDARLEGRRMIMILAPTATKHDAAKPKPANAKTGTADAARPAPAPPPVEPQSPDQASPPPA